MSLTVATISPFDHRLEGGKRRKGNGFIDAVDAVDRGAVHHQHAGPGREQIGAAGKGALDIDAVAGDRLRDAGRGDVFRDVAVLQPDHDDFLDAGALHSASTSAGPIVVPFLSTSDPWRRVWTVTPPIASAGLAGPNFMRRSLSATATAR